VPDGEVVEAALGIARSIVRHPAFGVSLTKRVMRANLDAPSLEHAVLTENHTQVLCNTTAGFLQGVA
jgi:enoyl-CoA hydratase/carnithine racemase